MTQKEKTTFCDCVITLDRNSHIFMSWIVEQSDNTSAVHINGNTITSAKEDFYSSPINVLYKDPADRNGQYFWQIEVLESDSKGSGNVSVGLTTEKGFRAGWGLRAMNYLGNLSDGSAGLVLAFGDHIKANDKVGLLLQLNDEDLKMYIFHNDRPLGLAFHVQSPYPKPLYPVISFDSNGKVKISRSQHIPTSLNRAPLQFNGIEGHWEIVDYSQHPECIGRQIEINLQDQNIYSIHTRVVNNLIYTLKHDPTINEWKSSSVRSTLMSGPPELMNKEILVGELISSIKNLEIQNDQQLVIETNKREQVRLERFIKPAPSPVTENIFNE